MADVNAIIHQIDELVAARTFSLEALDGVKKLRESVIDLERKLKAAEDQVKLLREEQVALVKFQDEARRREVNLTDRESKVAASEIQDKINQKELALTRQFKDELKEIVHVALRNPIVRTNTYGSMPITDGNGYITSQATSSTTETTTE